MQVAAVQLDIAWEDKATNHTEIERMLGEADISPGAFVLLPELGDTGFSFNLDRIVDERSLAWGRSLAKRLRIWLQIGYAQRGSDGRGRNCAARRVFRGFLVTEHSRDRALRSGLRPHTRSGTAAPQCRRA